MAEATSRQLVLDYLDACYSGDIERAARYYADDIDFIAYAPVDLFPSLGQRKGKTAMVESLVDMHRRFEVMEHRVDFLAADGAQVAVTLVVRFRSKESDRVVRLDIGNFYSLRDGQIAVYRQFLDSFDIVQQVLGREIINAILKPGLRR